MSKSAVALLLRVLRVTGLRGLRATLVLRARVGGRVGDVGDLRAVDVGLAATGGGGDQVLRAVGGRRVGDVAFVGVVGDGLAGDGVLSSARCVGLTGERPCLCGCRDLACWSRRGQLNWTGARAGRRTGKTVRIAGAAS
jgi:hypothetical protein